MYTSMKSSWVKMSHPLRLVSKKKKTGEMGKEEIQQSLTDKAQCAPSPNPLCSHEVRVEKGEKSKSEKAFLKSYRG